MRRSDFQYDLPPELIAQFPPEKRGASRLLHLDRASGEVADLRFAQLPGLLRPGDLLIGNDTRVIPARLFGRKSTGGHVELLVERLLDEHAVLAQIRASKAPKPGTMITLEGGEEVEVTGRREDFFTVRFASPQPVTEILEAIGQLPLPPYIERPPEAADRERYQTVFARENGAVAAPTAGLHFTPELLAELTKVGVNLAFITLHVGAGTFQPVRVEDLDQHQMHAEWLAVDAETCAKVEQTRAEGGRIIAVGTTSARALESAAATGELHPYQGDTRLFITPGYPFRVVNGLITNFHLPESTLLMLVCALAGYPAVMAAYRHAVAQRYRFFSYGDAMILL